MITLALGIGANTAVFTLADALLMRPLGVADSSTLATLERVPPRGNPFAEFSYPEYRDLSGNAKGLTLAGFAYESAFLRRSHADAPQLVLAGVVTGNFFELLGVRAAAGRTLTPDDDRLPNGHPIVVLSHEFWNQRFGGSPEVLGQQVVINNLPFTVVGIAPSDFVGLSVGLGPAVWVPAMMQPAIIRPPEAVRKVTGSNDMLSTRGVTWLEVIGRLKPGVRLAAAQAQLGAIHASAGNGGVTVRRNEESIRLHPLDDTRLPLRLAGGVREFMVLLSAVTLTVFLLAAANVGNLLLQQATTRRAEMALRVTLGAGRGRLVAQITAEAGVLALAACAMGVSVGWAILRLFDAFRPPIPIPVVLDLGLDVRVLAFTFILSMATALVFAVIPAVRASRVELVPALRRVSRAGRSGMRLQRTLVGCQIALSSILLVWAVLLLQSLQNAGSSDLGFRRDLLLTTLDLEAAEVTEEAGRLFYRDVLDRLRVAPGIRAATVMWRVPFSPAGRGTIANYDPRPTRDVVMVDYNIVAPGFFRTLGIGMQQGHDFDERNDGATPTMVINESLRRLETRHGRDPLRDEGVIGLVADVKTESLAGALPCQYLSIFDRYVPRATVAVRGTVPPDALARTVRHVVEDLNPRIPITTVETMDEHLRLFFWPTRVLAMLVALFGALALSVALIGIFGVSAYSVTQRTHEIGVRIALGAQAADVYRLVGVQAAVPVVAGSLAGIVGTVALERIVGSFLYAVKPTDPLIMGAIVVALMLAALVAVVAPAMKAAAIDPATTLRCE